MLSEVKFFFVVIERTFVSTSGMGDPEPATSSDSTPNVRSGALFSLPPLPPLDIHASNAAEKWKEFEQAWTNYAIAMKLQQEDDRVQVATLLTVIGAEARKVFATFADWANAGDQNKLHQYCKDSRLTVSHYEMFPSKDTSLIQEFRKRESCMTITERCSGS